MTEPVRRKIEQPSQEKAKRSGCLIWGAVLGVLFGIMAGVYALPPILKHYYGETVVAPGETFRGDGKTIRLVSVSRGSDADNAPPGRREEDFFATIIVLTDEEWPLSTDNFSLEFKELDEWRVAVDASVDIRPGKFVIPPGKELEMNLHFTVESQDATRELTIEALHLSDPRVRFELKPR